MDTDTRWWGYSHRKGWAGYMDINYMWYQELVLLHTTLSVNITTTNVYYNQAYPGLVSDLSSSITIKKVHYMGADRVYDDHNLYI